MRSMWWGLILGAILGLLLDGVRTATVLGFLGWLAGVIIDSRRDRTAAPAARVAPAPVKPPDRMTQLEMRVAALEAELAALKGTASAAPEASSLREVAVATEGAEMPPPLPEPEPGPEPEPEPQAAAPLPPPARKPNPLVAWITGGNAIARVGVVILFIGVALLLRHAVDQRFFPPEVRIAGAAAFALAALVFGWRLRHSRPGYALSLQGAGVGMAYLTIYGAYRIFDMLPAGVAFPLLVGVAILATVLAVRQDAAALAGLGAAGGFLAPVLAASGAGDPEPLFSYYAVLNVAILVTAWFRGWRSLNLLGFAFTLVVALVWGDRHYQPEYFPVVEPFLVFFFVLYVVVAILFARKAATPAGRMVDAGLVFGVPLAAIGLQAGLMADTEHGLAWSSLALAVGYLALAAVLRARREEGWGPLSLAFLALGVAFATLAVPLFFETRWTSAAWALEGAAIVWFGQKQERRLAVFFGIALQVMAGGAHAISDSEGAKAAFLANREFLGGAMLAIAGIVSHLALRAGPSKWAGPTFLWAIGWWLVALFVEMGRALPERESTMAQLAVAAFTTGALAAAHRRWNWREAAWPAHLLLPAMVLFLGVQGLEGAKRPMAHGGWMAWPLALAAYLAARRWVEPPEEPGRMRFVVFQHAGLVLLAVILLSWELHWWVIDAGLRRSGWASPSLVLVPALTMLLLAAPFLQRLWPVAAHPEAYLRFGLAPVVFSLWIWVLAANALHNGRSDPWPYMPGVNAVDLAHVLVAMAAIAWWRSLARLQVGVPVFLRGSGLAIAAGSAAFAWVNGILLRSLHHWADVPYRFDAWKRSFVTQASLSILWTAVAAALMIVATRRGGRPLWMAGAALMAIVVAKLAFVDLAHLGGLERIASFIGVGLLMLGIGYVAPVPPRERP